MSTETHQDRIDKINKWIEEFKNGNAESAEKLINQFEPFLKKTCNRYNKYYSGVFSWESIMQDARMIFYDLLMEYTIGGSAYFNVYIQRKLPLRLRYKFVKEIKRRQRDLSHSDEQFLAKNLIGGYTDNGYKGVIERVDVEEKLSDIKGVLDSDILNDRERDMFLSCIVKGESHESIANRYGISRSRVSRIIKNVTGKIQLNIKHRI